MRKMKGVIAIFILAFMGFGLSTQVVDAQVQPPQACSCWCAKSGGAIQVGASSTGTDYISECQQSCSDAGARYLDCTVGNLEPNRARCWTDFECTNSPVTMSNGQERPGIFGSQPDDCVPGKSYCFAPLETYNLMVPLEFASTKGGTTTIGDLSGYISALYFILIPMSAILAVVMIMIGGLQWMAARGNSGGITQAKERMGKAVLGLALVLGAVSIAELIDPRLTNLEALRVPRIKTVTFLDPNTTCEVLRETHKFEISEKVSGANECGDEGTVEKIPEDTLVTGFNEGDTCKWSKCNDTGAFCVSDPEGNAMCQTCSDSYNTALDAAVGGSNPGAIAPSAASCALLQEMGQQQLIANKKMKEGEEFVCLYKNVGYNQCVQVVTAGRDFLDCEELKRQSPDGCSAYNTLVAKRAVLGGYTGSSLLNSVVGIYLPPASTQYDYGPIQHICSADPCGFQTTDNKCAFFEGYELSVGGAAPSGVSDAIGIGLSIINYVTGEPIRINTGIGAGCYNVAE